MRRRTLLSVIFVVVIISSALYLMHNRQARRIMEKPVPLPWKDPDKLELVKNPTTAAEKIVNGAKLEAMRDVQHDGGYYRIDYPDGDVPADKGACTDVVVRALRNAGYDLQKLMHEDMKRNFRRYPQSYSLNHPDPNIDHRRVPNQMTYFRRHGRELSISTQGRAFEDWKPGDIIYWKLWDRLDHCGIISNDRNANGVPLVIHNIGQSKQEDCLTEWRIIGHFRFPK